MKKKQTESVSSLKVIPLGGLEQIGMNITAFEYEDSIIVVDCGLSFPEDDMLGIDLVIPDVTYLKNNIDKVKGFMITHGHEDHIGALPYILKDINVPVYATKLTMGIIENKLKEHELLGTTKRKVVKFGQSIILGQFRIEFIKTNHSIVDAAAALQIDGISEYRCVIHLKVSCMHNNSRWRIDGKCCRILNTVVRLDKFHTETAKVDVLSVFYNFTLCFLEKIMLLKLVLNDGCGQFGRIDWHIDITQHIRDRSDMILMGMCDKKAFDLVNIILQIGHIRDDKIDSVHIILRE